MTIFSQFIADCVHTFSKARMLAKIKQQRQQRDNTNFRMHALPRKKYKFTVSDTHGHHSLLFLFKLNASQNIFWKIDI